MQDEEQKEEEGLLEILRAEVARLLCTDDVGEEERLSRLGLTHEIIENGDV
jgi:hypothetical protein